MTIAVILQATGGQGGLGSMLILILPMVVIMYFLVFRPQSQQRKRAQEMQSALKAGDRVITGSGIYGTISGLDGDTVILKIADTASSPVKIRIARAAIAQVEASENAK